MQGCLEYAQMRVTAFSRVHHCHAADDYYCVSSGRGQIYRHRRHRERLDRRAEVWSLVPTAFGAPRDRAALAIKERKLLRL